MLDLIKWLPVVGTIIGVFSAIATITPNHADNVIADILLQIINAVGMNFGKARNEVDY